ncbi:MAG: T9SS type A sorting domain-containing protein [Bacteroidia bacterium]
MTLTVYTADQFNSGHVVEAGFDKFEIIAATGINTIETDNISLTASPNPFNDVIQIHYKSKDATSNTITVTDIAGRIVKQTGILPASGSVTLGSEFSSGVYFVRLNESGKCVKSIKVVKN